MKIKLNREALIAPLSLVSRVVERKSTQPILSHVLLDLDPEKGLSLSATDTEVEMSHVAELSQEASGKFTVPARKLLDICKRLPDRCGIELDFDGKDSALLRAGRSRYKLAVLPAEDFPLIDPGEPTISLRLPCRDLVRLIAQTEFAIAQQDVRYYLTGLLLEVGDQDGTGELRAVATDGHRLAMCRRQTTVDAGSKQQMGGDEGDGTPKLILPRRSVQALRHMLEDAGGDTEAVLSCNDNTLWVRAGGRYFCSKLIDGNYPDYKRVIPQISEPRATIPKDAFRRALERAEVICGTDVGGVRLRFKSGGDNMSGELRIHSTNSEQEEAEELLEVQYDGPDLEIGFNVRYLLDALDKIFGGDEVRFSATDSNSSVLMDDPSAEVSDTVYVLMPMRI